MIDPINNINDFLIRGYVKGNLLGLQEVSYFDQYHFVDCLDENISNDSAIPPKKLIPLFENYASQFEEHLILKLFPIFKRLDFGMWQGVDLESRQWHNDFLYGESFNSNILVYLEEHSQTALEIKNGVEEIQIPVKAGDFIWINQSSNFQHRARQESGARRILSFEYFLPGLT